MNLTGTVPSYTQYLEAAAAARRVAGVSTVDNNLMVVLPERDFRDDVKLATAANNALTQNVTVPDHGKPETASIADLHDDPALRAEIQAAVDDANKAVSHAEAIKKFVILGEEFTEAGGQLTPTLKARRYVITEQYAVQIAALYKDAS